MSSQSRRTSTVINFLLIEFNTYLQAFLSWGKLGGVAVPSAVDEIDDVGDVRSGRKGLKVCSDQLVQKFCPGLIRIVAGLIVIVLRRLWDKEDPFSLVDSNKNLEVMMIKIVMTGSTS